MKQQTQTNKIEWKKVELGDIFTFQKKSNIKAGDNQKDGKYKFFTSSDIQSKFIDKAVFDGEYLIFSTGGSAGVHYCNEKFSTSTDCFVVKIDNKLISKYVYYYLFTNIHILEAGFKGAGLKHISKEYLKKIKIIYPEKKESQQKIVSILEKAEKAKELRKEADALTKDFLKAVFMEMFDNNIVDTKSKRIKMKEILVNIDSGWSPVCESYPRQNENQKAILKLGAVTYGFFNPLENKCLPQSVKIPREVPAEKEDLLFSRKNTLELVGATAFCFKDYKNLFLPDTIFKLNYNKTKINGIFLWKLLSDTRIRKDMQALATGSAGSMPNISKSRLLEFEIPLPHLTLQNKFASIVKEVEAMKEHQKHSKDHLDNLFNALMQKAFKGELV